jgi:GTPase SAR1 family protein
MDPYQQSKEAILTLNQELATLIHQTEIAVGSKHEAFAQWEQTCDRIARHVSDHVVRIAVVGAIKSGKSTLVNSLLKEDYLKRGAGVVTSIVTRVRTGRSLSARLFLKSWNEINAEIEQALVLFPTDEWRSETHRFDIRREKDRQELTRALDSLDADRRVVQDSLNANSVLLYSYLKGYDQIQDHISGDSAVLEFDAQRFGEHRAFAGNDALAVYLKDIQLDIIGDVLAGDIEMADCQGSDSPNPLHLAMIQDYLLKAHLIIYVISSRTGLRQADIRFLTMIKRMGIAEAMLFICNCDFSEHDGKADLQALIDRVRDELAMITLQPQLFTLSALFNLFSLHPDALPAKDAERLAQWKKAEDLALLSNQETQRLKNVLTTKLTQERSALLLQNQLERIDITAAGLFQWVRFHRDLLHRDAGDVDAIAEQLQVHQNHMHQVQSLIRSTLDGAVQKTKKELKTQVDRFFDRRYGLVVPRVVQFVGDYQVDLAPYTEQLDASGFTHCLYGVFQDFKQALDGFMAEKINPDIIAFGQQQEKKVAVDLSAIAQPFEAMARTALARYEAELVRIGLPHKLGEWSFNPDLDMESLKQLVGLSIPAAAATMSYTTQIRTEAIVRLGVYNLVRYFRKLLNKPVGEESVEGLRALKDGIRRMRRETERSLLAHFKDYQENFKFQYVLKLVDVAGSRLVETLTEQFSGYVGDLKKMVATIGDRRGEKERIDSQLAVIEEGVAALQTRLVQLRQVLLRMREGVAPIEKAH